MEEQGGVNLDGAVAFFGMFGADSTDVTSASYTLLAPTCRTPPCSFVLTQFNVDLNDFSAGSFEFVDPHLELATPAGGWRDGVSVELPIGALQLTVSTGVKVNGEYLLGYRRFEFEFSNTEPVSAPLSLAGAFTIEQAEFNIYGEHAVLNTSTAY